MIASGARTPKPRNDIVTSSRFWTMKIRIAARNTTTMARYTQRMATPLRSSKARRVYSVAKPGARRSPAKQFSAGRLPAGGTTSFSELSSRCTNLLHRALQVAPQPEPDADPACAGNHQIDAQEDAQNVKARYRPLGDDQETEQKGDGAGERHPDPGNRVLHAEGEHDAHDARHEQRKAEQECQHRGG